MRSPRYAPLLAALLWSTAVLVPDSRPHARVPSLVHRVSSLSFPADATHGGFICVDASQAKALHSASWLPGAPATSLATSSSVATSSAAATSSPAASPKHTPPHATSGPMTWHPWTHAGLLEVSAAAAIALLLVCFAIRRRARGGTATRARRARTRRGLGVDVDGLALTRPSRDLSRVDGDADGEGGEGEDAIFGGWVNLEEEETVGLRSPPQEDEAASDRA